MKIRLLFSIFLFICILVSGCGKKIPNSRAEFQEIASKVEMDIDPANVSEFEMYLPKGYIEYIPDSREYKKTTVTLPSGKEKKVKCPYAQSGYKKNKLEECAEGLDKNANGNSDDKDNSSSDRNYKYFINYENDSVLQVMAMSKANDPTMDKMLDNLLSFLVKPVKDSLKKCSSYSKEYDLSSYDVKIDFLNAKLKEQEDGFVYFVDFAVVKTSTGNALIIFYQAHEKTHNDIIATLLSIKPASNNPVKSDSDDSVKSDLDSESKENK